MSKKLQVLLDPIVVIFFENALDPTLVNFFGNDFFFISKKITTTGSTNTCTFFTFNLDSFNCIYIEIRQEFVNYHGSVQGTRKWLFTAEKLHFSSVILDRMTGLQNRTRARLIFC